MCCSLVPPRRLCSRCGCRGSACLCADALPLASRRSINKVAFGIFGIDENVDKVARPVVWTLWKDLLKGIGFQTGGIGPGRLQTPDGFLRLVGRAVLYLYDPCLHRIALTPVPPIISHPFEQLGQAN